MSALDQLIEKDLVNKTVYEALAMRPRKASRTGFVNICCPMCASRGEGQDKKFRCGVSHGDGILVKCFNCDFKTRWKPGDRLSKNMREFLGNLGMSSRQVQIAAYWADQIRGMLPDRPDIQAKLDMYVTPDFPVISLPDSTRSLTHWAEMGCTDPNFLAVIEYLYMERGEVAANATTYYWSSDPKFNRYIIIPCYQHSNLVGWMARCIDKETQPRYHKSLPNNFIFNSHVLSNRDRKYVLIFEGIFDALVMDGIGALGATLNDTQIAWIIQSGKQPVVVNDRDRMGDKLVEIAIRHKWPVATMYYQTNKWWEADVKDADQAVRRYGKLYTLQSIFANLTWQETQIKQRISYKVE